MPRFKPLLASFGVFTYLSTTYAAYHIYKIYNLPSPKMDSHWPQNQPCAEATYDNTNLDYDNAIKWDELILGIDSLRKTLVSQAKGDTIELAAGTARNLPHYNPDQVSSIIFADKSRNMLNHGVEKYTPKMIKKASFILTDSHRLDFADKSFNSVVETFGLCSLHDPVEALREMGRVLRPDGKILLLEHGRSYYEWLNTALDKTALDHARSWGCFWNRDIIDLVEKSGLCIDKIERYHFGTTYSLICSKPNSP